MPGPALTTRPPAGIPDFTSRYGSRLPMTMKSSAGSTSLSLSTNSTTLTQRGCGIERTCFQEALGLNYKNSRELNHIIDTSLPGRPHFRCKQVVVAGESFELYYRPVLDCIRWIFGDPNFAGLLVFIPERNYSDKDNTERLYHDMHTGKWWWDTQVGFICLKRNNTIF